MSSFSTAAKVRKREEGAGGRDENGWIRRQNAGKDREREGDGGDD